MGECSCLPFQRFTSCWPCCLQVSPPRRLLFLSLVQLLKLILVLQMGTQWGKDTWDSYQLVMNTGPQVQSGPVLPTPPITANICSLPKTSREVLLKSVCLVARIFPPEKQGWRLVFKPLAGHLVAPAKVWKREKDLLGWSLCYRNLPIGTLVFTRKLT